MRPDLNNFVPADELHWNESSNTYNILSQKEQEEIIGACLVAGVEKPADIIKVVREYEAVKGGALLFDQFLSGRLGICGFDESDSPIFESVDPDRGKTVNIESRASRPECDSIESKGRFISCEDIDDELAETLHGAIVDFCSKWEIDIFNGENPEEADLHIDDPSFFSDLKRRGWSVSSVEVDGDSVFIEAKILGRWLRTKY